MTTDEMRDQKGRVLLDCQETEQKLAQLKVRAERLGNDIEMFGRWLRTEPETMIFRELQAPHGFAVKATPTQYVQAMDAPIAFALAEEIRETAEELRTLQEQKRRLGLK